jgi:hypothetical protein
MSDQHQHVVADRDDPVGEILQTFRAPTGPSEMSRARRLARAAHAAALSLREVAHAPSTPDTASCDDARCALTAVTVDAAPTGGYVVAVHLAVGPHAAPALGRAVAQQVRQAADDRGLGHCLDEVRIVVEGVRP